MEIKQCKTVVKTFLNKKKSKLYASNKQLVLNKKKYRIRPDDIYYFSEFVLLIEYENNKRPVESISKYWWLLEKIKKDGICCDKLKFCIFLINNNIDEIRKESVRILGDELSKKYPDIFEFHYLMPENISKNNIEGIIEDCFNS